MSTTTNSENGVKNISWNEAIARNMFYNALPLSRNGKSLDGAVMADLILLQVDYAKVSGEYENRMQEALQKLKAEICSDYDSESMKPEEERRENFKKDEESLLEAYTRMRVEEALKPCPHTLRSITAEEFAAVCALGADGNVTLANPQKTEMPLSEVLKAVAMTLDRE